MKSIRIELVLRRALSMVCVPFLLVGLLAAQEAGPGPNPQPGTQAPAELLSPQQLDTLVAPVALYPDRLLSQILVASTYPLEIAEAAQWVQQNNNLQGQQLTEAARQQNWDASIQAMVVFPDVLNRLSSDIRWTTDLGNAFLAQQADVMNAVQRMRARAEASGKLRSNEQQTVTTEMQGGQSAIDIQPANPEVVYVPVYNPQYIWGPPAYGYYPPWDYADIGFGLGYGFGPGIYIGGFFGGLGWGGWGWGPNWFGCSIFQSAFFFNHYGYHHGFGWGRGGGFGGHEIWAHDPGHRLGVAYPNRALNTRYGAMSSARARSSSLASRMSSTPRANGAQSGWNRFGQNGSARQTAPRNGSGASQSYNGNGGNRGVPNNRSGASPGSGSGNRASPSYGGSSGGGRSVPNYRPSPSAGNGSGYRASPSYGGSYGGGRSVPNYHPSPSFGNSSGYRASPSYGGSYGGGRSVPSYRPSPSFGNGSGYRASPSYGGSYGGGRSVPSYRPSQPSGNSGGYRSYSGGGSSRSGGGSVGGGGGRSFGGGGGSHGGGSHGGGRR